MRHLSCSVEACALVYQIFILNGFFIVFYKRYNHATNSRVVLNDWGADCVARCSDLHQRAIYKCGDFIKNTVVLPLSAVVCAAMVWLLLLKIPISQMGKTYRCIHRRPQEVCH